MPKIRHPDRLGLHLRVVLPDGIVIGPGRAELLQAISDHGSISAAGRAIGMSYKRAWELAEAVNGRFHTPLIETSAGGVAGGGTRLTAAGKAVLAAYRRIEHTAADAVQQELQALTALLSSPGNEVG
jgi:molybdate transport system regulatory protein